MYTRREFEMAETSVKQADASSHSSVKDLCKSGDIIKGRWHIVEKIGSGGFGQIYKVKDDKRNIVEALKVEPTYPILKSQLPMELQVLKKCQGQKHIVVLFGAGIERKMNYIAMQLLGPNVSNLRRQCPHDPKRFSISTAVRLATQTVEALRDFHAALMIHRDIKPSNFAVGLPTTPEKDVIYLLDFGLARTFVDANNKPLPPRDKVGFRGTIRYCSVASHLRQDLSRKDDLVSLYYMLCEGISGNLPWRDYKTHDDVAKIKKSIPFLKLGKDWPADMKPFIEHVDTLKFETDPNYTLMLDILQKVSTEEGVSESDQWDWENNFAKVPSEDKSSATGSVQIDDGKKSSSGRQGDSSSGSKKAPGSISSKSATIDKKSATKSSSLLAGSKYSVASGAKQGTKTIYGDNPAKNGRERAAKSS